MMVYASIMLIFSSKHIRFFFQAVSVGEDISPPKVPSGLICTVSVKCPPRREDEVYKDEIMDDFKEPYLFKSV